MQVTKPVESFAVGINDTDSEEDEFDKERQHSVLPHPAGEHPFQARILGSGNYKPVM